ncbi:hypothetical protein VNO80_02698 [Phaseolus coccineus]|uniref:Uncharacterized protein n=1 Tax=Phaseolus coccineus TaxID=3886 RepID=A0AAN9NQR0_PHACN
MEKRIGEGRSEREMKGKRRRMQFRDDDGGHNHIKAVMHTSVASLRCYLAVSFPFSSFFFYSFPFASSKMMTRERVSVGGSITRRIKKELSEFSEVLKISAKLHCHCHQIHYLAYP